MAKISITRPSSTGTNLYGSLRKHYSFVSISIWTGNCGDHYRDDPNNDTGYKSARGSRLKKRKARYHPTRESRTTRGQKEFLGYANVEAELTDSERDMEVIEVNLSFEQFAELITSTGHRIDCTISSLRGFGERGEVYVEDVPEPSPVADRMKRRIEQTQAAALHKIDEMLKVVDTWNASAKVKDEARRAFDSVRQSLVSNTGFAVEQAVEEMSVHAEAATTIISEKIVSLERAGRLPKGSTERFLKGDNVLGLPTPRVRLEE